VLVLGLQRGHSANRRARTRTDIYKEKSMRHSLIAGLMLASVFAAPPALAQAAGATGGVITSTAPGKGLAVATAEITANVVGIDKANRLVTLKGPKGDTVSVVAGPKVRNFDQIKVGDMLRVQLAESLVLELKKGGTAVVARTEIKGGEAAKAGEKPGAMAGREVRIVADVVDVDRANQTVTLRGPKQTVSLKIRDPEQLKLIDKGDQVEATYTEAVALAVTTVPRSAAKK
jgi:hypothetical protein